MRSFLSGLCLGLLLSANVCLPAGAQAVPPAPVKYWIFLSDKGGPAGKRTAPPAGHLSEEALERRARRGRPAARSLDAPVSADYLERLGALGVEVVVESRWLNAVSAFLAPDVLNAVRGLPFVREVRPVGRRAPAPIPALPPPEATPPAGKATRLNYGASYTQLALMNAIGPLEEGLNGTGVRLGFLDTEYGDFQHPAFDALRAEGRLLDVRNFAQGPQSNRHGLQVASVVVGFAEGELVGPAHGAEVLAATTEYAPTETNQEEDNFVAGLEWLEAQGVDVVNVSLGYTEFDDGERSYTPADLDGDTGVTTFAVDIAASLGVVVVTSAGNEGCASPETCWYYIGTPADADSAIAVGAVQSDSTRAPFSSFGPTADGRIKPDVAAMGVNVRVAQPNGSFTFSGGTSFASPLVAGVACQMLQVNPNLTPVEVRDLLRATASQSSQPDSALGWGIVNAAAAIEAAAALQLPVEEPFPQEIVVRPYPNPFAARAWFDVRVPPGTGLVRLSAYNVLGQRIAVPFDGYLAPGLNRIPFDARRLAPGVYLYVLEGEHLLVTGTFVRAE